MFIIGTPYAIGKCLEHRRGIGPRLSAWKAEVLTIERPMPICKLPTAEAHGLALVDFLVIVMEWKAGLEPASDLAQTILETR